MIDFIMNNISILASNWGGLPSASDCSVLGKEFTEVLNDVFTWIQVATPCLVLVLCCTDILRAVIAQEEKDMKAALSRTVKRVMIGVAIFFVPMLLNFVLYMAGIASGTCKIGV